MISTIRLFGLHNYIRQGKTQHITSMDDKQLSLLNKAHTHYICVNCFSNNTRCFSSRLAYKQGHTQVRGSFLVGLPISRGTHR